MVVACACRWGGWRGGGGVRRWGRMTGWGEEVGWEGGADKCQVSQLLTGEQTDQQHPATRLSPRILFAPRPAERREGQLALWICKWRSPHVHVFPPDRLITWLQAKGRVVPRDRSVWECVGHMRLEMAPCLHLQRAFSLSFKIFVFSRFPALYYSAWIVNPRGLFVFILLPCRSNLITWMSCAFV